MTISITDLTWTNNMANDRKPILTDFETAFDSVQDYLNDYVKDNLVALAKDSFPSGYAFANDGTPVFSTYNLFDKQSAVDSYTGGDLTISTTGAWTDLDATNCSITLTPEGLAGDFKVTAQFMVSCVTTNATNEILVRFRLTDGSETSTFIANIHNITGVTSVTQVVPVSLVHHFDSWSVASKTVKVQYYIQTQTQTTLKVLANSNQPFHMLAEKV